MTEPQPTWGAAAQKTWGEIAGETRQPALKPGEDRNQYVQDIGTKLEAQQAEIEVLKAEFRELRATVTALRVDDYLRSEEGLRMLAARAAEMMGQKPPLEELKQHAFGKAHG